MTRLTVAAAALAAGMLTIVAQSQAESDRNIFHKPAVKGARADRPADKRKAEKAGPKTVATKNVAAKDMKANDIAAKGAKRIAGLAKTKKARTGNAKAERVAIDFEQTASIGRVRPNLKAIARKSAKGFETAATGKLDSIATGNGVANAGYTTLVSRYATAYGVPASLADAVISVESNYRPTMRGSAGEIGLMQIKPATARMMGYTGNLSGLFNPETNIKYGMKYLGMAHQLSGGVTCGTILRYNAGHGARRMNPVSAAYCSKVKLRLAGGLTAG